jgi:phage terminase large subunit GpA-like protein
VWTAYAPNVSWESIVREFFAAFEKFQAGDSTKLKDFHNTTLGRTWGGDIEATDASELQARAEPYPLGIVPRGGLILLAGVDTQDNRLEVGVWAIGRGVEKWPIEHQVFFGNPAEDAVWGELDDYLFNKEFPHVAGGALRIHAAALDTGGHNTHAGYEFCRLHKGRRVYATKGRAGREKAIKDGANPVDIDWRGRRRKNGVILWHIGTNHAKDLLHNRLAIERPGPGYIHFSSEFSPEWFAQYAAEVRTSHETASGTQSKWIKVRRRNEVLDCAVGVVFLEQVFEYAQKSSRWWDELESRVQPIVQDMFQMPPPGVPVQAPNRQPSGGINLAAVMAARK